jgi:hypothetical protein
MTKSISKLNEDVPLKQTKMANQRNTMKENKDTMIVILNL